MLRGGVEEMFNSNLFPIIEAEGTPFEIGYIHGSQGKKQVEKSLETYKAMFKDYANIEWEEAKERAKAYIKYIEEYDADLLAEIEGVAKGADKDLEDILALNVRSEIVLMGQGSDGCTSMGIMPEVSLSQETILAQNWDWKLTQMEAFILLKIKQENKPDITMVTEAGIIGKIGLNSSGLGVCLNALGSSDRPRGVPLHIILRGILNSRSLSDAISAVARQKNACSANYLIAHAEGEAVDIEATPHDFDVLYPQAGIITHTNHFTSLKLEVKDTLKIMATDSFIRLGRINKILRNHQEKIGLEDVKGALSDHIDYPDSICRHEDLKDDPGLRLATVFSIIMNLNKREVYIAKGNPCENEYILY